MTIGENSYAYTVGTILYGPATAAAVLATRMFQGRLHSSRLFTMLSRPPRTIINDTAKAKLVDEY